VYRAKKTGGVTLPDGIRWKKFRSTGGADYEVGSLPSSTSKDGAFTTLPPFDIDVDWPVSNDGWHDTKPEVRKITAITRYALGENSGYFDYICNFTCTEHYDYYFTDHTNDTYPVSVSVNGDHYFRYNSKKPTIKHIRGE
jgi:hypothetical protein